MAEINAGIKALAAGTGTYKTSDTEAWEKDRRCPHCGTESLVRVVMEVDQQGRTYSEATRWLRCTACRKGSVIQNGSLHPTGMPLRQPKGLPKTDDRIWHEVRVCLGAGAYAATVMLCRKLLFHVAVANGLPAKNAKDRAPTYLEAVEHLEAAGVFTGKMRKWIDKIKEVGNDANHELEPITEGQARDVAAFTQQLLVLAYELDALMADPTEADDESSSSSSNVDI
jgi:hypothetical protein